MMDNDNVRNVRNNDLPEPNEDMLNLWDENELEYSKEEEEEKIELLAYLIGLYGEED